MLRGIKFNDERFEKAFTENFLSPITENAIILCRNYKLMDSLMGEILDAVNNEYKTCNESYWDEIKDDATAVLDMNFELQKTIAIRDQKITLSVEPAIIYKANNIEDIWFFDCRKKEGIYKEYFCPICDYENAQAIWDMGKDSIYKGICCGRYGTFECCLGR